MAVTSLPQVLEVLDVRAGAGVLGPEVAAVPAVPELTADLAATRARAIALQDDSAAWRVFCRYGAVRTARSVTTKTALEAHNPASVPFRHRRTDDR